MHEHELFENIISWFRVHKRFFLWRKTKEPYHQLLAEFVFQQTRIEQGMPYYMSILERYPTLRDLAIAQEDEFLKLWQGLGYYRRAHHLMALAREVIRHHNGLLPKSYQEIIKLPGVGPYMGSLLASQWSGEPVPAIDGNVRRVISRIFLVDDFIHTTAFEKKVKNILQGQIAKFQPGEFNESLMELGALICKPRQPLCLQCPINSFCQAYQQNLVTALPKRLPAKTKKNIKLFYWVHLNKENFVYMKKRKSFLWSGLYEFPLIENTTVDLSQKAIFYTRHELTHRRIHAYFISDFELTVQQEWEKIDINRIQTLPVHILIEKFLHSKAFQNLLKKQLED